MTRGEVEVKDLVTGKRSTVEVGSLRGRDAGAASDPRPHDGECGRPLDDDWSLARERESVIQNLLAGEGEIELRARDFLNIVQDVTTWSLTNFAFWISLALLAADHPGSHLGSGFDNGSVRIMIDVEGHHQRATKLL